MRLSVIVPCRNAAATIEAQLEALSRQRIAPSEILVVDNGSTDGTAAILERYRTSLPHLRVIRASARRNAAYARNQGMAVARGDAFVFCDADDEVDTGWVEAMGRALERHGVVASRVDARRLNTGWAGSIWDSSTDATPGFVVFLGFLPAASGCGFGFTRRVWETVGRFDESFVRLEDIDYSWRAQLAGFDIHYAGDAVVHYRYRATLGGTWRQCFLDGRHETRLYEKYRDHGMPWRPLRRAASDWVGLVRGLPALRTAERRAHWVKCAGFASGRLSGSIRHRVLAL